MILYNKSKRELWITTLLELNIYFIRRIKVRLSWWNFRKKKNELGFITKSGEDTPEDYSEALFYKNEEMLKLHAEIGYNTKIDLEGSSIYTLVLKNSFIVSETMNIKKRFFQYVWFPREYYYYMLTVTDDIESDCFSKKIVDILKGLM